MILTGILSNFDNNLFQKYHLPCKDKIACLEAVEVDAAQDVRGFPGSCVISGGHFACILENDELFLDTYLIKLPGVKL